MHTRCFPWLTIVLVVALFLAACGSEETPQPTSATAAVAQRAGAEPATQAVTTEATAAPTQPPAATPAPTKRPPATPTPVPPTPTPQPTKSAADEEIALPNEALDSYRSRTTTRLLEAEGDADFPMAALLFGDRVIEMEFVREPESTHVTMTMEEAGGALETIAIGEQSWINMGGGWISVPTGEESAETTSQQGSQIDVNQMLKDMQQDMRRLGSDTVNGIDCQRYAVDSEFTLPLPAVEGEAQAIMPTEMTGKIQGEVCIVDERDLPRVMVQEQSVYEMTLIYASGAQERVKFEQQSELFDINEPFTIEPPEGASTFPGLPSTPTTGGAVEQPTPATGEGVAVQVASLEELDSYRMEYQMDAGQGAVQTLIQEWLRTPPARRLTRTTGGTVSAEWVVIGDQAWRHMFGNVSEVPLDEVLELDVEELVTPDDEMVLLGEDEIDGVRCQRYVYDFTSAAASRRHEICVADEPGLPPVVIQAILEVSLGQGGLSQAMTVTDLNQPLTIEPPQ